MKLTLLAIAGLMVLTGCSSNYSDGFRMGVVRKFSNKGIFIKSYEGELLLGGVVETGGKSSQLVNETWDFSVDPECQHGEDTAIVVQQLTHAAESGKRVKLSYHQDTFPKIRTQTDFMVYKAEIIE